jgi:hypothetical protein
MARSKVWIPLKPLSEEKRKAFLKRLKDKGEQVEQVAPPPVVTVAPTVANYEGGSADAARIMKAIKVLHAAFGEGMPSEYRAEITVPIPVAIVDTVIDILSQRAQKAREARAKDARKKREWRDEIVKKRGCSRREAARRTAKKFYPNLVESSAEFKKHWNTIYRSK